jgi:hypothetical protein
MAWSLFVTSLVQRKYSFGMGFAKPGPVATVFPDHMVSNVGPNIGIFGWYLSAVVGKTLGGKIPATGYLALWLLVQQTLMPVSYHLD